MYSLLVLSLWKGDRTTPMVALGRKRLLGCFLGNLEIGYSSTSVGRLPSDFKLPSFPRIGNIFVDVRRKDHGNRKQGRPLVENSKHGAAKSNVQEVTWTFETLRSMSRDFRQRTFFFQCYKKSKSSTGRRTPNNKIKKVELILRRDDGCVSFS